MLKKIGYVLDKGQKIKILILAVIILIGSLLETFGISAIMPLVSVITDPKSVKTNGVYKYIMQLFKMETATDFVLMMALSLIIIYIVKNVYLIFMYAIQLRFVLNNQYRMSYKLMDCYLKQDYLFHTAHNVAELQVRMDGDVAGFFRVIQHMITLTTEMTTCIFIVVFLIIEDPVTTLTIAAVMGGFLLIVMRILKKKSVRLGRIFRQLEISRNKGVLQAFNGIKDIKISNKEQFFLDSYASESEKIINVSRKQNLLEVIPRPLMETVIVCGVLAIISVKILMNADLKSFIPILSVFVVAAVRLLPSFSRITTSYGLIMYSKPSVDAVYDSVSEMKNYKTPKVHDENATIEFNDRITIKDLKFAYPSRPDNHIIDGISVEIPKNCSAAFIGASGAGKTTLVDVILGILEPQKGNVLIDGKSVFENMDGWHKIVGYIPQFIYLCDDTIRANVAFGVKDEDIDDDKVWEALRKAQLDEFVRTMPEGIQSNIGDKGVKLSGGQRQRIGIARALYRDPQVLVLDEATSSLDNETETAVMDAIDKMAGTITMIIIAHRLSTIRNCDIIYEVAGGKAVKKEKEDVLGNEH